MEENKRNFKGVWIPKEVWLDNRLTALDKIILIEIDSLNFEDKGCFASNEYLADFCQCSTTKVSLAISKLIKYDYISLEKFNGRQRELKSRLSKNERQTFKKCKADFQKVKDNNIYYNNKLNNKEKYKKEFSELWQMYPNKKDKERAMTCYIKYRDNGTTFEEIKKGIENYTAYINQNNIDIEFIKNGGTWFYRKCWQDEYKLEEKSSFAGYDLEAYEKMLEES